MRLAVDLGLSGEAVPAGGSVPGTDACFLALGAGAEGTVERVDEEREPERDVREYERLTSLLGDFGHQMPPDSRKRLEEQIASLEPAWTAHRERGPRPRVRVRFDNGFVVDGAPGDLFTAL
ncbi:hypothetical protein [Streptomyces sp. NPDC001744]|uniref:hypothetical protein n=1 Tax=Streptomyces sp. NPDC001744 TaxID=3364606 RepID=UPI0036B4791B